MQVLISPVNLDEAKAVYEGGADIIDIKNVNEGSLGAQFPWVVREIVDFFEGTGIVCSATLGDLPFKPGTAALAAHGVAHCGVGYLKAGMYGVKTEDECFQMMEGIARGVRSMTLLCPIQRLGQDETAAVYAGYNHRFSTPALQILELPDYKTRSVSLRGGLRQVLSQFRLIWCQLDGHDTVFVMMSTFRAAFAAVAGRLRGRRVILYSGNDWYADMASSYKFKGPLARLVYPFFRWFCGFAERRAMGAHAPVGGRHEAGA